MLNISLYNLFQMGKQGMVTSKVANDNHHQLLCLLVENKKIGVGVRRKLKFGWVKDQERISFMSPIWLGAIFDMITPPVSNSF